MKNLFLKCAVIVAISIFASQAHGKRRAYPEEGSMVVAHSEFGNGSISGRVRNTPKGRQVQTPGRNWLYCSRSCAETLRVNTVDFWQSDYGAGRKSSVTSENRLFGPLRLEFSR